MDNADAQTDKTDGVSTRSGTASALMVIAAIGGALVGVWALQGLLLNDEFTNAVAAAARGTMNLAIRLAGLCVLLIFALGFAAATWKKRQEITETVIDTLESLKNLVGHVVGFALLALLVLALYVAGEVSVELLAPITQAVGDALDQLVDDIVNAIRGSA